jgi:hypothetical protein
MLLKRKVFIFLAVVAVCLSGITLAKAVKQELVNEDIEVIGKAKLNYGKGANKTEIQVNCWDLDRETEYIGVLYEYDDEEVTDRIELGRFTTNKKGRGHAHARVEEDVSDWCIVIGIEVEGDDGTFVIPCGYGTKMIGFEPVLPIEPFPGPNPIWDLFAPKVVDVDLAYSYYDEENDCYVVYGESTISVTFDRPIDRSTVTENTFIVDDGYESLAGTRSVTNNGLTVVFEPDESWGCDKWITVTLVGTPYTYDGIEVMKGIRGLPIDGDADGDPGGNFTFFIWVLPTC